MKGMKVWAVLGAAEGFGPSIVKYLRSRDQSVIPLTHDDPTGLCESLKTFTGHQGLIDILIENWAYGFIDGLDKEDASCTAQIEGSIRETIAIVKQVLPYMTPLPEGRIICMPPKPCLLMASGEPVYDERAGAVERYSFRLEKELSILVGKMTYLAAKAPARYGPNNHGE